MSLPKRGEFVHPRKDGRFYVLSIMLVFALAGGMLYLAPKYLSAKHAASSTESALIDASPTPCRASEVLEDEELCGVISNKKLRDYLSFTTSNYWYSNKPKSDGRGGSFRCQIYSPEVVSGSRFVRITYGLDDVEVRKIRSGASGYSRHEYAAVGVSGEGWKMGRNHLVWIYPDGYSLHLGYSNQAGGPRELTQSESDKFDIIFARLIEDVPAYNQRRGDVHDVRVP